MKLKIVIVCLISMFVASFAYAASQEYTGYLSDVLCAKNGKDPMGTDLTTHPEKHTLKCLQMPPCVASGHGIFIQGQGGKYAFTPFDKQGSDLAKAQIVDKTKKTDNLLITVKGEVKDGVLTVESLSEVTSQEYTGYLSDVLCGKNGKDPMGLDLTANPEKHTLGCLQMAPCTKSGFGIFLKGKDGKYVFTPFDKKGSDLAKAQIVDKTKKVDNLLVTVKGTLANGVLTIESITEATK